MKRFKYPRTPHVAWSPGIAADDLKQSKGSLFDGKDVVVTEKMDGENTTMYSDYIHARSLSSMNHPSRNWVKQLHASLGLGIPTDWRICGENLYARHSIAYDELESYFYLFSVWNEHNECLSWDETVEWAQRLHLPLPKVLYKGVWDKKIIQSLRVDPERSEGYVIRLADRFTYEEFGTSTAKWVRRNHIQTDDQWRHSKVITNTLKK
jgi:hypothetical protein